MAHPAQFYFVERVKQQYPNSFTDARVLEVGSLNINGSIRGYFDRSKEYIGLDIGPGPGVDVVFEGQKYPGPDRYFDTIISCECFEHNPHWLETFLNMWRMLRYGGLMMFTCATEGRPEHGTINSLPNASPLTVAAGWSYYRNLTESDFRIPLNFDYFFEQFTFETDMVDHDLRFYGIKRNLEKK